MLGCRFQDSCFAPLCGLQPYGPCQFLLPLVKGPEALGFKLKGRGNMEGIESAEPESGGVTPGELSASVKGRDRNCDLTPQAIFSMEPKT